MSAFVREMRSQENPILRDPNLQDQIMENGNQILTDVIQSARAGHVRLNSDYKLLAREVGVSRAAGAMPATDSLSAAVAFFEAVLPALLAAVEDGEVSAGELRTVLEALNRSINMRIREASTTYTGFLLNEIHEAHRSERHRVARELHDRIGNGLSVAHRQLELFDADRESDPLRAVNRVEAAHRAVTESMENLRAVNSDLRLEAPLNSLEKALVDYIDSMQTGDVRLHLRVNGDETWATPPVRDESFLIIREAVRNALAHSATSMVLIGVDIAPHELRAMVEDTGRGFDRAEAAKSGGTGLSSMRERATLLGGTITLVTRPDHGTQIELVVPLSGIRDAAAE